MSRKEKKYKRNVTLKQGKERKKRKKITSMRKKKITTEGKEKMEKAKQLMEGTDESKGKYKKRKQKL